MRREVQKVSNVESSPSCSNATLVKPSEVDFKTGSKVTASNARFSISTTLPVSTLRTDFWKAGFWMMRVVPWTACTCFISENVANPLGITATIAGGSHWTETSASKDPLSWTVTAFLPCEKSSSN